MQWKSIYPPLALLALLAPFYAANAQDEVAGTLLYEEPFDEDTEGWFVIQRNGAVVENFLEEGVEGQAVVFLINTPDDITLNSIQFSIDDAVELPEGANERPWLFTFWIRVLNAPFTIRPIIFNNADPWDGKEAPITIETPDEWVFVQITPDDPDELVTDFLSFTFHMGNPGDEFGENEVAIDGLKVYLLDEETSVGDWMVAAP